MPKADRDFTDRIKQTRLEELDVKAKTILQAWNSARIVGGDTTTGYGAKQQEDLGTFVSSDDYRWTDSYYRNSDDRPYRPGPGRGSAETVNHQSDYLDNNQDPELGRKIGSVLFNSQQGRQWHGGPIPPDRVSDYNSSKPFAKFSNKYHARKAETEELRKQTVTTDDGTTTELVKRKVAAITGYGPPTLEERWEDETIPGGRSSETTGSSPGIDMEKRFTSPRRYDRETKGQIDVSVGDATLTVPDSPQNREIHERFLHTMQTKKADDDGLGMFDYFFMLVDQGGGDQYGRKTIRSAFDKMFGTQPLATVVNEIPHTNEFAQNDTGFRFDDAKEYSNNLRFHGEYDEDSAWARQGGQILPVSHSWPTVTSTMGAEKTQGTYSDPFAPVRLPRNLEELWNKLIQVSTDGPYSPQVQRDGQKIRLSEYFGPNRLSTTDYKVRFLGALNGTFANVPDKRDVKSQGEKGFNVGQVAPYGDGDPGDGNYVFGDKREMDFPMHFSLWRSFAKIHNYEQELMDLKPGGNRINVVFNIRMNLSRLLQQNLLMPSDIHPIDLPDDQSTGTQQDLATAIEAGRSSIINDNTFTKLYLQNRSALHAKGRGRYARHPPGTIGGRAISDLQGPATYQTYTKDAVAGIPVTTSDADDASPVFRFTEDADRATLDFQDRGFIDNIAGNVFGQKGIAGLLPAVENDPTTDDRADKTTLVKTLGRADEQFFPFMFETVNKGGSTRMQLPEYKQYAYFQATLQSLSESYAPAWSSKHFFGRTEQIHTYTMTERTLDLTFVILATEIRRLQNLYERVSWLAQQTYPSYDSSNRMKSGPLIRMSIGDMFSNLSGFIRSLSFDWNFLGPGGKWEISQGLRIPMACTVTMNFTVMHDDMPDRNYNFYPGPMLHPAGLRGWRGTIKGQPDGGPLIPTADRMQKFTDDSVNARYQAMVNRADGKPPPENEIEIMQQEQANEQLNTLDEAGGLWHGNALDGTLAQTPIREYLAQSTGYLQMRNAQYIDVLDYNTSKGDQRVDEAGNVRVGDFADQIF